MNHLARTALAVSLVVSLLATGARAHIGESDKLLPSDGAAGDQFGTSVDVDGGQLHRPVQDRRG